MLTDALSLSALVPAKLNLGLAIVGRRDDGFHELVTIMQTISLCDRLTLTGRRGDGSVARVTLSGVASMNGVAIDDPGLIAEENLAVRAVSMALNSSGAGGEYWVALDKGIPAASGMGGASADAGAGMLLAERLAMEAPWLRSGPLPQPRPEGTRGSPARSAAKAASTPQAPGEGSSAAHRGQVGDLGGRPSAGSLGPDERLRLAAALGSDVPFFLTGGTALVTGRGEHIEVLPAVSPTTFIVVFPRLATPIPRKTARLFAALLPGDFDDGEAVRSQLARIVSGMPLDPALLGNGFERALLAIAPELTDLHEIMADVTRQPAALSGAGPTHYVVEPDRDRADWAIERLGARLGDRALVLRCEPWAGPPEISSGESAS